MTQNVPEYRSNVKAKAISTRRMRVLAFTVLLTLTVLLIWTALGRAQAADSSAISQLSTEATALAPLVTSQVAKDFLAAVPDLPALSAPRIVYYNKEQRAFLSEAEFMARTDSARAGFERRELGEQFYYYTRYGTPLAFVRPLDLLGEAGLASLNGARVVDFGFGSIGQLRLMASLGGNVTGIEVDPLLPLLYAGDSGAIPAAPGASHGASGSLNLVFGSFPSDGAIAAAVPDNLDAFVSKNTLKRGYIHPEREVDPRMLVQLGVDDSTFVREVYRRLKPGGFFLIYNLHPARSLPEDEKYIPWSDGRSPFDRATFEAVGFQVVAFDVDDTQFARTMGTALGWAESMDFEKDLFGTYTLVRRPL